MFPEWLSHVTFSPAWWESLLHPCWPLVLSTFSVGFSLVIYHWISFWFKFVFSSGLLMLSIFSEAYGLLLSFHRSGAHLKNWVVFLNSQMEFGNYLYKSCVRCVFSKHLLPSCGFIVFHGGLLNSRSFKFWSSPTDFFFLMSNAWAVI